MNQDITINSNISKDEYTVTIVQPLNHTITVMDVYSGIDHTESFTIRPYYNIIFDIYYDRSARVNDYYHDIYINDTLCEDYQIAVDRDITITAKPRIYQTYSGNIVVGYDDTTYSGSQYLGYNNSSTMHIGSCDNQNIFHIEWYKYKSGTNFVSVSHNPPETGGDKALLTLNGITYNGYHHSSSGNGHDDTCYTSMTTGISTFEDDVYNYLWSNLGKSIPVKLDIVEEI